MQRLLGAIAGWLLLFAPLAASEGIAVSPDGLIWHRGVGGYGDRWGHGGQGVTVRQGETIYVRFYSSTPGVALHLTEHGRPWGEGWRAVGPVVSDETSASADVPIVLRITKVGTAESVVTWINGRGLTGAWGGLPAPGPYDLALHGGARWTRPPIVIEPAQRPSGFWAWLAAWLKPADDAPEGAVAVPDSGLSAGLLALSLTLLLAARRFRT